MRDLFYVMFMANIVYIDPHKTLSYHKTAITVLLNPPSAELQ